MTYREHQKRLRMYREMFGDNRKSSVGIAGIVWFFGFILAMSQPTAEYDWMFPLPNLIGTLMIFFASIILRRAMR